MFEKKIHDMLLFCWFCFCWSDSLLYTCTLISAQWISKFNLDVFNRSSVYILVIHVVLFKKLQAIKYTISDFISSLAYIKRNFVASYLILPFKTEILWKFSLGRSLNYYEMILHMILWLLLYECMNLILLITTSLWRQ